MRFESFAELAHRRADVVACLQCGHECVQVLVVEERLNQ